MTIEELQTKIKDQMLEISAYENKVKELGQIITRQEKIIEDLRDYIRNNLTTKA